MIKNTRMRTLDNFLTFNSFSSPSPGLHYVDSKEDPAGRPSVLGTETTAPFSGMENARRPNIREIVNSMRAR
jgi:hypothetical protein